MSGENGENCIWNGTVPGIDHEVRKLAENTTYYVQVFDAIDGVKEFLQSISFFGIPCAIYKVEV